MIFIAQTTQNGFHTSISYGKYFAENIFASTSGLTASQSLRAELVGILTTEKNVVRSTPV